jgi:hypothetical protein
MMAFFMHEEEGLREEVLRDTVARAVGLMSWRKTGEVEPYYVEGLLHLDILFEAGVLDFDGGKLAIDLGQEAYRKAKALYEARYIRLASAFYLPKKDASGFLAEYVEKSEGVWHARNEKVRAFCDHYWERNRAIGQETMPFE